MATQPSRSMTSPAATRTFHSHIRRLCSGQRNNAISTLRISRDHLITFWIRSSTGRADHGSASFWCRNSRIDRVASILHRIRASRTAWSKIPEPAARSCTTSACHHSNKLVIISWDFQQLRCRNCRKCRGCRAKRRQADLPVHCRHQTILLPVHRSGRLWKGQNSNAKS